MGSLLVTSAMAQQIDLVSRNYAGTAGGNDSSMIFLGGYRQAAQGRYVAFVSLAKDLVPNTEEGRFRSNCTFAIS